MFYKGLRKLFFNLLIAPLKSSPLRYVNSRQISNSTPHVQISSRSNVKPESAAQTFPFRAAGVRTCIGEHQHSVYLSLIVLRFFSPSSCTHSRVAFLDIMVCCKSSSLGRSSICCVGGVWSPIAHIILRRSLGHNHQAVSSLSVVTPMPKFCIR